MLVSDRGIDLSVQAQRHFLLMVRPSVSPVRLCGCVRMMHLLCDNMTTLALVWIELHKFMVILVLGRKLQANVFIENYPLDHWLSLQTVYNLVNLLISVVEYGFIDFLWMVTSLIRLHICPYMSFNFT